MLGIMDDQELFMAFVTAAIDGKSTLLSNANLRLESAFGQLQLVDNKTGIIATTNLSEVPIKISVKRHCNQWEDLRQSLIQSSFFPLLDQLKGPLVDFQQYPIPEGCQLYDCPASDMWRSWRREAVSAVYLLVAGEWRSPSDLSCSGGVVFVTFPELSQEVQVTSSTPISWLGH